MPKARIWGLLWRMRNHTARIIQIPAYQNSNQFARFGPIVFKSTETNGILKRQMSQTNGNKLANKCDFLLVAVAHLKINTHSNSNLKYLDNLDAQNLQQDV